MMQFNGKKNWYMKHHILLLVSNTTKKDIKSFYKISDKKISVIYHGTNFAQNNE